MLIQGAIKAAIDKLLNLGDNPDFPYITDKAMLAHVTRVFPFMPGLAHGTLAGTGVALTVQADTPTGGETQDAKLEFTPQVIIVANETTGCLWISALSEDGKGWKLKASDNSVTFVAADAITRASRSFTLGTDADLNAAGNVIRYIAIGL